MRDGPGHLSLDPLLFRHRYDVDSLVPLPVGVPLEEAFQIGTPKSVSQARVGTREPGHDFINERILRFARHHSGLAILGDLDDIRRWEIYKRVEVQETLHVCPQVFHDFIPVAR